MSLIACFRALYACARRAEDLPYACVCVCVPCPPSRARVVDGKPVLTVLLSGTVDILRDGRTGVVPTDGSLAEAACAACSCSDVRAHVRMHTHTQSFFEG